MARNKAIKLDENEESDLGYIVVGMVKIGWSLRKVSKAIGRHIDVVSRLYSEALDKIENGNTDDFKYMKGRKKEVDLVFVGDSQDLENIETSIIDQQQGRGHSKGHTSDY